MAFIEIGFNAKRPLILGRGGFGTQLNDWLMDEGWGSADFLDDNAPDAVGGLLALPLPDTLKRAQDGRVAATVERADKWLAQTPQMFRIGALLAALLAAGDAVTDEASAMEHAGHAPLLVLGGAQNFKVTYPDDFALAEAVLMQRRVAR